MTGDFISVSPFNPMHFQIAASFIATSHSQLTLRFWPSVGETIPSGVFFRLLSCGAFTHRAEIDDVSHALSESALDA
jgi:hypothetical protein